MSFVSSASSDVDLIDDIRRNNISKLSKRQEINDKKLSEQQRRNFFLETIHIYLKHGRSKNDDKDELVNDEAKVEGQQIKEWRIQRIRLNPNFLQEIVDRLLHSTDESGAIIGYLKEKESGQIILPDDMQRDCRSYITNTANAQQVKSHSYSYQLFLARPNKTKDIMGGNDNGTPCYRGQMKFVLHNVPLQSQNSLHQVKAIHVQNWIVDVILSEDVEVRRSENKIKSIMNAIETKRRELERVSEEPMLNEKGQELVGKKAQMKRQERYELLQREKDTLHVQYDEALDNLQEVRRQVLKKISMTLVQNEDKSTWEFVFLGKSRESLDNLIVKKQNWNTSFMHADPNVDLLSGNYQSVPDKEFLVDSAGISIERLENGFGCFHQRIPNDLDTLKNSTESHIYAFHGTYHNGKKCGHGILFSDDGVYGGKIEENKPRGDGVIISKDGDIIRSIFDSPTLQTSVRNRVNPYLKGVPHGTCSIQFSDGAYYEGQVEQGVIHGQGTYVSSSGQILEGKFVRGALVQGKKVTLNGDIFCGSFEDGLLNGQGSCESKDGRCKRKGYFIDGFVHGVGEEVMYAKNNSVLSRYTGMFCNGRRSGLGCFDFRDCGFNHDGLGRNPEKDELCQRGYWIAGQPKSGGMITKKANDFAIPTTQNPTSRFRWLSRLKKVEEKKMSSQDETGKCQCSLAQELHSKIEAKKRQFFDQQESAMKSILFGVKGAINQYHKTREQRHKALPSHSKYYVQRKTYKAPSSLEEALKTSQEGLQIMATPIHDQAQQRGLFRRTAENMKKKWSCDGNLILFESDEMKMIHEAFEDLEEEWSTINIDRLRHSLVPIKKT